MRNRVARLFALGLMSVAVIVPFAPSFVRASAPEYEFTTIEIPGARSVSVNGINSAGDVVGNFDYPNAPFSFIGFLIKDGVFTEIRYPDAIRTIPWAIAPSGEIIGFYVDKATGLAHGFVRSADGALSRADGPSGSNTEMYGILPNGSILGVGYSGGFDDNYGFVKRGDLVVNTGLHIICSGGTPDGKTLVGINWPSRNSGRAFVIDGGGDPIYFSFVSNPILSWARSISPNGNVVVGWYKHTRYMDFNDGHAFIAERKTGKSDWEIKDFAYPIDGVVATRLNGINAAGDMVGSYNFDGQGYEGFVARRIEH